MRFKDLKVGDQVIVIRSGGLGPTRRQVLNATVTHVTKTRFKTTNAYGGIDELTWTREDGREYPRSTGWSRTYEEVCLPSLELAEEARLNQIHERFARAVHTLRDTSFKDFMQNADEDFLVRATSAINNLIYQVNLRKEGKDGTIQDNAGKSES